MWELYTHFSLLLLNLVVWLGRYRQHGTLLHVLGYTLLLTTLVEGLAAYLMLQGTRNLFLYHFLTPLQYALYTFIFYKAAYTDRQKKWILYSIPLYLIVSVFLSIFIQKPNEFNSYALTLRNILLVCWSLNYYRDLFKQLTVSRLDTEPMFWISTGLFFYSLGSFFVYGLMNYLLQVSHEWTLPLYYITLFLGFILHLTYLVAFSVRSSQVAASN